VLADVEVVGFDLLLGVLDRALIQRCSIGSPSSMPRRSMIFWTRSAPKMRQQIVLEREEEARAAGIALAARAAAQLVVDAPALVALGAEDVEAARPASTCSRSAATWARYFSSAA
jgi:hypothetical protein